MTNTEELRRIANGRIVGPDYIRSACGSAADAIDGLLEVLNDLVQHTDAMEAQNPGYHENAEGGVPCRSRPLLVAMDVIRNHELANGGQI